MRLDRLITLNLVQPARRTLDSFSALGRGPGRGVSRISILMYHSVSEDNEPVAPYYVTNTRPATFREQMRFLAKHNYCVTDLETAVSEPRQNDRTVVITFDDGFRDFYTNAFPILREFGYTATMFLPTSLIGGTRSTSPTKQGFETNGARLCEPQHAASSTIDKNQTATPTPKTLPSARLGLESLGKRRKEFAEGEGLEETERVGTSESLGQGEGKPQPRHTFKGRDCMTWDEVRALAAEGIHFGSHTVSHPKLYDLDWSQIEEELAVSKETLEHELGREITTFAYPFAYPQADRAFTRKFETLLQKTGYRCNVTTRIGRARLGDNPFSLRRLPMNSFDDTTLLRAKLEGNYDWLARPQAVVKKVKRWL